MIALDALRIIKNQLNMFDNGGISEATPLLLMQEDIDILNGITGTNTTNKDDQEETPIEEVTVEELKAGGTVPTWTLREIIVTILSCVAASLGICVMYTIPTEEYPEDWLLYDIFNILAIMIPFYSAYQEQKVTETKVIKKSMIDYKTSMEQLALKNNALEKLCTELQESTSNIGVMKDTLKELQGLEADAIEQLSESLTEKENILKDHEISLVAETIDNIIDVLLKGDDDQDMKLSKEETHNVIKKLEGINNVDVRDDVILEKVREYGCDLHGIMHFINDAFDKDPTFDTYLNLHKK